MCQVSAAVVDKRGEKCRHVIINQSLCRGSGCSGDGVACPVIHRLGSVLACSPPTVSVCLEADVMDFFRRPPVHHLDASIPRSVQIHRPSISAAFEADGQPPPKAPLHGTKHALLS